MNAVSWFDGASASDRWRRVLLARGPQVAVWVLALAIGVQAAVIVTDLANARRGPAPAIAQAPVPVQPAPRINVAAIANNHLFGEPPVAKPVPVDAANAPKTNMPLVLTGIIAAENPRDGFAIVGENASASKVYAVGDNLPGGARLHSIYEDRVLLDRGGQIESLPLPKQIASSAPPIRPPVAAAPSSGVVDRVRRLIAEEPGLMSDIMRPQPVFAQGKQRGYRVYPGRNRQAFSRLGLRPGDLVLAVNGTPLDDPARAMEVFKTIGSSSEAHITVMRNGRQEDLTLNIAQVAAEAEQLTGGEEPPADEAPQIPPDDLVDPAQ